MQYEHYYQQSLPFATAVLELVVDQAVDPYSIHRARARLISTKLLRESRDTSMTIMIMRRYHIKIGGSLEQPYAADTGFSSILCRTRSQH
jgi:hypothetical protein